jgi:hypothetical protein
MLKAALVGAGIVFAANMINQTDYVKAQQAANPDSFVWQHGNVLAGALMAVVAHKFIGGSI